VALVAISGIKSSPLIRRSGCWSLSKMEILRSDDSATLRTRRTTVSTMSRIYPAVVNVVQVRKQGKVKLATAHEAAL
jgi:hypothetical protein